MQGQTRKRMRNDSMRAWTSLWRDRSARVVLGIAMLASILALALSATLAPRALGFALADDALFVKLAQNIGEGRWLGAYDDFTLVKGPFYPLFLSATSLLGLPLLVAQQLVSVAAAGLTALAFHRLAQARWTALALFAALALNPLAWHPDLVRVTREPLYASLGVAAFALAALVVLDRSLTRRMRLVALAAFSAVFAAYWLTREESVWLYPALAMLALVPAIHAAVAWWRAGFPRARLREGLAVVSVQGAALVLPFAAIMGAIAALNAAHYGAFLTDEVREGAMPAAYGALIRIREDDPTPRLFFAADAAARAYEASAAARELKPAFDGPRGEAWRKIGCDALALTPCPTGFGGGWFMWALREAAREAGHMRDAASAQAFFERLAHEINEACDAGKIPCGPARDTMAPPLTAAHIAAMPNRTTEAIALALRFGFGAVGMSASEGTPSQVAAFRSVVGPIALRAGETRALLIAGWLAAPECLPMPAVVDRTGKAPRADATLAPAPDVENVLRARGLTPQIARFKIVTTCAGKACRFVLDGCGATTEGLTLSQLKKGPYPAVDRSVIFFERIQQVTQDITAQSTPQTAVTVPAGVLGAMMQAIAWMYSSLVPFAFAAALILFALALARFRAVPPSRAIVTVALAALVAIVSRALLIAVIDVTSWNAINVQYMSPAAPFVLIFIAAGIYLGARVPTSITPLKKAAKAS